MKIERVNLLKRLLAVSPGITPTDTIKQSSCVVLKRGRFYTMNREIACSIVSGLDKELEGVIVAKKFLEFLKKFPEDEVSIAIEGGRIVMTGKKKEARIGMEAELFLPIGSVELPDEWIKISSDFGSAIDLVSRCTKRKANEFGQTCVHVHPKWLEACDNSKMARWVIPTFVSDSVLVRGVTLRTIINLGMTKAAETQSWLHFKNPYGLRVSLRKWTLENPYPPLDRFLKTRGEPATFPKAMADAADRAASALDEADGSVKVVLTENKVTISGFGTHAEYAEERQIQYEGRPLTFLIPPKLIAELVAKQSSCEVSEVCLRVANDNYTYLTNLEVQKDEASSNRSHPRREFEE